MDPEASPGGLEGYCSLTESKTSTMQDCLSFSAGRDAKETRALKLRNEFADIRRVAKYISGDRPYLEAKAQEISYQSPVSIKNISLLFSGTSDTDESMDILSYLGIILNSIIPTMKIAKDQGYAMHPNADAEEDEDALQFFCFDEAELASVLLKFPELLRIYFIRKVRESLTEFQLSLAVALQWLRQLAAKAESRRNFRLVDQRLRVPRPVCARPRPPSAALAPPA